MTEQSDAFRAELKAAGLTQADFRRLIERLAGPHVVDLCWHLPTGVIDRRFSPPVSQAPDGAVVTLSLRVGAHQPGRTKRQPYRVHCHDDSGEVVLVFFHAHGDYLKSVLPQGETRFVSGRVEHYNDALQMTHPDHILDEQERYRFSAQAMKHFYI